MINLIFRFDFNQISGVGGFISCLARGCVNRKPLSEKEYAKLSALNPKLNRWVKLYLNMKGVYVETNRNGVLND